MSNYIKNLIDEGEHVQQDFKFLINDSRKIAKTFSAFANTIGGKLLVGVKDNGSIAGVRSDEELYMLEAASNLYLKPSIVFSPKVWVVDGKTIVEVDIPKGDENPYKAENDEGKWIAYIRVKDQNYVANKVQLKVWANDKYDKGVKIRYDTQEAWLLQYLSTHGQITLSGFVKKLSIKRWVAENILAQLVQVHIIKLNYSETGVYYSLY